MIQLLFFILSFTIISLDVIAHGGGLDALGCHNNRSTGDYHCHGGGNKSGGLGNENYYNTLLARKLNGITEVTYDFHYGQKDNLPYGASVRVDIVTDEYVIEGGLDRRSSLDSIQQAIFASSLAKKEPAIAMYDTDNFWGPYEHRIWTVANELEIKFIWFNGREIKPIPSGETNSWSNFWTRLFKR